MQTNRVASRKIIWTLLFLAVILSLVNLFSCKKKETNVSCVTITKAQFKKWVDDSFITSSDTNTVIRIKAAYGFPGTIFKVYAGVQDNSGNLIPASIIELAPLDTCNKTHIHLSEYVFSGTLPVSLSDWNIWKPGGGNSLSDSLAYIQLEPLDYDYESLPLLAFDDYFVNKNGVRTVLHHTNRLKAIMRTVLPCPPCPNCKEPCPPPSTCPNPCTPAVDTTSL